MSDDRVSDLRLVAAAGVLTIVLAAAVVFVGPPPNAPGGDGSSFSPGARGAKAAFDTLQLLGYTIERSIEPITSLGVDASRSTLVLTGSELTSDLDKRALTQFLDAGGHVIAIGAHGADALGLNASGLRADPFARPVPHRPVAVSALIRGVEEISMVPASGGPLPSRYLPVFALSATEPLVVTATTGQGRATWLAVGTPFSNEHLRAADNFQLLLNLMGSPGERRILWDEHYHGYSRSLWSYAVGTPLPWILAQCALLAFAAVFTFSRRRLPVRSGVRDARTSPMEFIEMLCVLYARAGEASSAVTAARRRFVRRAGQLAGLPSGAEEAAIARAAAARCSTGESEIAELLARTRDGAPLDNRAAVQLTGRLQALTREMESARRGAATKGPNG